MTITFSDSSPKRRKSDTFGPKFKDFYFLHQALQWGKFKDADCKYDNDFSFVVPTLRILILAQNFAIRKIGGRWLQKWQ